MEKDSKLSPKDLTVNFIEWMSFGGCNPFERHSKRRFIAYMYVGITLIFVTLTTLHFFFTSHHSISSLVDDSVMIFGFTQVGAKQFTSIQKAEYLADMLKSLWNEFWPLDMFDENFKKRALLLYKRANYLANVYSVIAMLACCLFICQAGFNKALVIELWFPYQDILNKSPYHEMMYVFQGIYMLTAVWFSLIQLDRLFILLTCFICVQQKMIQVKLSTVNKANSKQKNLDIVQHCVAHQNILFRFLRNFEVVYSRLFLPTVGSNFILISLAMYGAIMEDSLSRKLTLIFIYLSITGQVFAYCYAGHLIQEEGLKIAEAAYNNDWYDLDDRNVKMELLLVTMRSQRKIELTVGGILILSLENFAAVRQVLRATFSFLTFIVNMRN